MNKTLIITLLFVILLAACSSETPAAVPPQPPSATPDQAGQPTAYPMPAASATPQAVAGYPEPQKPAAQVIDPTAYPEMAATATSEAPEVIVRRLADQAVLALKDKNMQALSALVNPADGVRISPYSFVREEDLVFTAAELAGAIDNPGQLLWGAFDGSGEPINLTFADYYAEFLYDVDFASAPEVSINERLGTGNTIDNAAEFYPGAMIVEYHFPGFDEQFQGMDWRSLRLVFQDYMGRWVLVGIIHDEWTT